MGGDGEGEKKERCLDQRQKQTRLKWPLSLDRIIKAVRSGCIPSSASFLLLEEEEVQEEAASTRLTQWY